MISPRRLLALVAALGALTVPATGPARAQEPKVLARSMLDVIVQRTNEINGVLIDALDADGTPDPARMSDEGWAAMATAVERLRAEASALRSRPIQVVANPGDKIFGEETRGLTAAEVQVMIDANRAEFNVFVDALRSDYDRMDAAIAARDAQAAWAASQSIDGKCDACHERFWYPDWQEGAVPPP